MPRGRSGARHEVLSGPGTRERPTAVVASATNYKQTPFKAATTGVTHNFRDLPVRPASQAWQTTAWTYYDLIGEYRYAVDWVGNLLSRVSLTVVQKGKDTPDQKAVDALDALYGGAEGQTDMLRQIGRHWIVAGDCYIVGDNVDKNPEDADWLVGASTQTTLGSDGTWKVNKEVFAANAVVIRVWRPHPTDRSVSDSPTQAVLPILAEVDGLTKHVQAQIDSRLAGAGILFVPNDMSFGSARPERFIQVEGQDPIPVTGDTSTVDALVETLIDVMSTAIADRADPAALVPIVIQADGEAIQHVKYMTFASELDKQAIDLRTEAIRRLALGMDMPPEILTGTSDMNHWSSWQIEEAAIKAHLEPLLDEICAALTEGYLRPALGDDANSADYSIVPDTTRLRLRPNRSKEAMELWDRGELKGEVLLRENGFDPATDLMDDKELALWLTRKVAGGSATPDQVQAALEMLGVLLKITPGEAGDTTTRNDPSAGDPNETRPTPSTKDHPTQSPPETQNKTPAAKPSTPGTAPKGPAGPARPQTPSGAGASAVNAEALVSAASVMVYRALERAGNKLKTKLNGSIVDGSGDIVPAHRAYRFVNLDFSSMPLDYLLQDAWAACDAFAPDHGVSPAWLRGALDSYTRDLLQHRKPYSVGSLRAHLALATAGVND